MKQRIAIVVTIKQSANIVPALTIYIFGHDFINSHSLLVYVCNAIDDSFRANNNNIFTWRIRTCWFYFFFVALYFVWCIFEALYSFVYVYWLYSYCLDIPMACSQGISENLHILIFAHAKYTYSERLKLPQSRTTARRSQCLRTILRQV